MRIFDGNGRKLRRKKEVKGRKTWRWWEMVRGLVVLTILAGLFSAGRDWSDCSCPSPAIYTSQARPVPTPVVTWPHKIPEVLGLRSWSRIHRLSLSLVLSIQPPNCRQVRPLTTAQGCHRIRLWRTAWAFIMQTSPNKVLLLPFRKIKSQI